MMWELDWLTYLIAGLAKDFEFLSICELYLFIGQYIYLRFVVFEPFKVESYLYLLLWFAHNR